MVLVSVSASSSVVEAVTVEVGTELVVLWGNSGLFANWVLIQ